MVGEVNEGKGKQRGGNDEARAVNKRNDGQRLFPLLERALACSVQHHHIDFVTRR
jgi:hypothetical protein